MIQQKIQTELEKIIDTFLKGKYTDTIDVFNDAYALLKDEIFDENAMSQLSKLFQIFFVAQLGGISTLNAVLKTLKLKSNSKQKQYIKLCNKLTNSHLHQIFEHVLERSLEDRLTELLRKDSSALSRTLVTVVLDDSIFKQWLKVDMTEQDDDFVQFYGKFFSGQMQQVVWGYQVLVLGFNVGTTFYPLYLQCVRKPPISVKEAQAAHKIGVATHKAKCAEKTALAAKIAELQVDCNTKEDKIVLKDLRKDLSGLKIAVKSLYEKAKKAKPKPEASEKHKKAMILVGKAGNFLKKLKEKGLKVPKFQFSADSGYNFLGLIKSCASANLNYIGVPSKSHTIIYRGKTMSIADFKTEIFLPAEAKYNTAQALLPAAQREPFTFRKRVFYVAHQQDVTILGFRLDNSNKISAIFTPDKNIFAKTLRRHWFARTQIEQFFRFIKHFMRIQDAKTTKKHHFECKILRFAFIALHLQQLIQILRKKHLLPKHAGLGHLRNLLLRSTFVLDQLNALF